ncbi:hypothetical protein EVC37_15630 [Methylocaldum sp. BRCS4]|jgi:hypothetical protein|nr:hypothetical protein [Methylocaldum sp. BRCS4]
MKASRCLKICGIALSSLLLMRVTHADPHADFRAGFGHAYHHPQPSAIYWSSGHSAPGHHGLTPASFAVASGPHHDYGHSGGHASNHGGTHSTPRRYTHIRHD